MWCAQCGKQINVTSYGSYVKCCNGYGYWSADAPDPKDSWWPVTVISGNFIFTDETLKGCLVGKKVFINKLYLYRNVFKLPDCNVVRPTKSHV